MGNRLAVAVALTAAVSLGMLAARAAADEVAGTALAQAYQQDECGKTGWGVAECPDFGNQPKKRSAKPQAVPEGPVRMEYQSPQEECGKTGWGIAECQNFGKRPPAKPGAGAAQPPETANEGAPAIEYKEPVDECMKTGWGTTLCPSYGRRRTAQ